MHNLVYSTLSHPFLPEGSRDATFMTHRVESRDSGCHGLPSSITTIASTTSSRPYFDEGRKSPLEQCYRAFRKNVWFKLQRSALWLIYTIVTPPTLSLGRTNSYSTCLSPKYHIVRTMSYGAPVCEHGLMTAIIFHTCSDKHLEKSSIKISLWAGCFDNSWDVDLKAPLPESYGTYSQHVGYVNVHRGTSTLLNDVQHLGLLRII